MSITTTAERHTRQAKVRLYEHHERMVWSADDVHGKHREHCLCWRCAEFHPNGREANCPIASTLFALCVLTGITTPVYECPEWKEKEVSEHKRQGIRL